MLGALGIGIPDIPLFTGVLIRSLYEMAGCHGCGWDSPEERYFQLKLIEGALSGGEELHACNAALNDFIREPKLPDDYNEKVQLERTARALSDQMLCMKFLQGIPLVGVVGGACDAVCLSRVQRYAKLKYQRRVLLSQKENV